MNIVQVVLAALAAYLIGAIPTGVIATKLAGAPDVRYSGSGHTGGTNTMQLTNTWIGVGVVAFDGFKGLLAWGVAYILMLGSPWALPLAGVLAVVGHCWPIYTRFHGGMGLATAGSLILIVSPITLLFAIPIWAFFYFLIFKRAYSPRCVMLAMLLGVTFQIIILPVDESIRWFLILVTSIIIIKHLPEWGRRV